MQFVQFNADIWLQKIYDVHIPFRYIAFPYENSCQPFMQSLWMCVAALCAPSKFIKIPTKSHRIYERRTDAESFPFDIYQTTWMIVAVHRRNYYVFCLTSRIRNFEFSHFFGISISNGLPFNAGTFPFFPVFVDSPAEAVSTRRAPTKQ